MELAYINIIIIWIGLAFVSANIADNKGRSGIGFLLLSIILSPLIGIIVALIISEDREVVERKKLSFGDAKKCPFCAEIIKPDAIVCRFCGRDLPDLPEKVT